MAELLSTKYPTPRTHSAAYTQLRKLVQVKRKNEIHIGFLMKSLMHFGDTAEEVAALSDVSRRQVFIQIAVYQAYEDDWVDHDTILEWGIRRTYWIVQGIKQGTDLRDIVPVKDISRMNEQQIKCAIAGREYTPHHLLFFFTEAQHDRLHKVLLSCGATKARNGGLNNKEDALMELFDQLEAQGIAL